MASTLERKSVVDRLAPPAQRLQQNNTITTYAWDASPYSDPTLMSSDSDSTLPSPTSPDALVFPPTSYTLPREEHDPAFKSEQAFNFGTFEDWMRWDDPTDAALSPTPDFFPELKLEPQSPTMSGLELQGSGVGNSNVADDHVVFGEDPLTEEPLFQTPNQMSSLPVTDDQGLYSTPLAWSRPTPGRHTSSYNNTLSPQQESKLRGIAMPSQTYPGSPSSTSSPEPSGQNHSRKRKSSVEDDDDAQDDEESSPPTNGRQHPIKKTAHNMIEKRYRTNLNDKIAALRDSVPSLRVMSKKGSRGEDIQEDLQGLTPAHKLNKATVLSKATEYIAHLEKRNRFLMKENSALKGRVDAFEILVMSRQGQGKMQGQIGAMQVQQQQMQQQRMQRQGSVKSFGGLDGMSGMM